MPINTAYDFILLKLLHCRWKDGNNLTSNLFTLITPFTTHKIHQTVLEIVYKPQKKKKKKKKNIKKMCDI